MRANEIKLDRIVNILHKIKNKTDEDEYFKLRMSAKNILDSMSVDERKLENLEKDKNKVKILIQKSEAYKFKANQMQIKIDNLLDDVELKEKAKKIVDSL